MKETREMPVQETREMSVKETREMSVKRLFRELPVKESKRDVHAGDYRDVGDGDCCKPVAAR